MKYNFEATQATIKGKKTRYPIPPNAEAKARVLKADKEGRLTCITDQFDRPFAYIIDLKGENTPQGFVFTGTDAFTNKPWSGIVK